MQNTVHPTMGAGSTRGRYYVADDTMSRREQNIKSVENADNAKNSNGGTSYFTHIWLGCCTIQCWYCDVITCSLAPLPLLLFSLVHVMLKTAFA